MGPPCARFERPSPFKGEGRCGVGSLGKRSRPIPNPPLPLKGREIYGRPNASPELRK